MKKIIILSCMSFQALAGDLIYKNGFENVGLVSGTASGLVATGLSLQLTSGTTTETLTIASNETFVFAYEVPVGATWEVEILTLPDNPQQQGCVITNNSGTMTSTGANTLDITCDTTPWKWDEMNWDEGGWSVST